MNLADKPLAMAYVPWQKFENVLDAGVGLAHGTVFEDLIFPFMGAQAGCQAKNAPCGRTTVPGHSCGRRGGYS